MERSIFCVIVINIHDVSGLISSFITNRRCPADKYIGDNLAKCIVLAPVQLWVLEEERIKRELYVRYIYVLFIPIQFDICTF